MPDFFEGGESSILSPREKRIRWLVFSRRMVTFAADHAG
jgi:hypothetical protein